MGTLSKKTSALLYQASKHRGKGYSKGTRKMIAHAIKTQRNKMGAAAHRQAYNKGMYSSHNVRSFTC